MVIPYLSEHLDFALRLPGRAFYQKASRLSFTEAQALDFEGTGPKHVTTDETLNQPAISWWTLSTDYLAKCPSPDGLCLKHKHSVSLTSTTLCHRRLSSAVIIPPLAIVGADTTPITLLLLENSHHDSSGLLQSLAVIPEFHVPIGAIRIGEEWVYREIEQAKFTLAHDLERKIFSYISEECWARLDNLSAAHIRSLVSKYQPLYTYLPCLGRVCRKRRKYRA